MVFSGIKALEYYKRVQFLYVTDIPNDVYGGGKDIPSCIRVSSGSAQLFTFANVANKVMKQLFLLQQVSLVCMCACVYVCIKVVNGNMKQRKFSV